MSNPLPTNPLDRYPAIRQVLYLIQWLVTGVQTVGSALLAFTEGPDMTDWPMWFLASLAVAPVLWAYLGRTAQTNVWNPPAPDAPHEAGDTPDDTGAADIDFAVKLAAFAVLVLVAIILIARLT